MLISILIPLFFLFLFDLYYFLKPKSKLRLIPLSSHVEYKKEFIEIDFKLKIINPSKKKETMIPNLNINLDPFNQILNQELTYSKKIILNDNLLSKDVTKYFPTTIVKTNSSIKISGNFKLKRHRLKGLKSLWFNIDWENYGHFGLTHKKDSFLIDLNQKVSNKKIRKISINQSFDAITIKTHLLGVFDDPISTISSYSKNIIRKNDILIIGETPLAIMQGRYITPQNLNYTIASKVLCYFFHPTSSLATACGMQLLINKIGITRTTISLLIGFLFKVVGVKGMFYRLAGREASLIDDITGTIAPYDKTLVMGPKDPHLFCMKLSRIINIDVAVVDVNDLGGVKVLSSSNSSINKILKETLKINPAGNDDQKTPIVLIRKKTSE